MDANRKRLWVIGLVIGLLLIPATVFAVGGTFTDDDTSVFEADIEWLAESGVTRGCNPPDNTLFCPEDEVTRGQMAAFMHRFAQYLDAEDGTPGTADNAEQLGGEDPTAYTTLVDGAACYFGECPDPTTTGEITDVVELEIDVPADGVLSVSYGWSGNISGPSNDLVQTWVTINGDPDLNLGCNGWLFAPTGAVTGTYAVAMYNDAMTLNSTASSTSVEVPAGTHTVRLCSLSLGDLNIDGGSLSTVWSAGGSGVPLSAAEFSDSELDELKALLGADVAPLD
jgi:hypothetical protein